MQNFISDLLGHPRTKRILGYKWLLSIAIAVFALDQFTKIWISCVLPFPTYGAPRHIEIIGDFFNLVHVGNTGAAWSLFSGKSTWLALLAIATLAAIYFWRHSLALRTLPVQISFGLLSGGILGNLTDRLVHGHVIDFLDFHFGNYIYPTFNIADCGICIGVGYYLIYSLKNPTPAENNPSAGKPS